AAGRRRHRHAVQLQDPRPGRADAPRRRAGGGRGPSRDHHRRHGQAGRRRHRRGHQSRRGRQAVRRRGLRQRQRRGLGHHAGARRRRSHDHRHAAREHPGSGRTHGRHHPLIYSPMTTNPLLVAIDSLIDYPAIRPEHVEQAVDQLLAQARQAVETVSTDDREPSWETVVEPLTDATETLYRAWSVAGHLNSVINTPELREAYNNCLPRMSEFSTWVGLNRQLFLRYQALADSPAFAGLSPQRQRIVTLALRDFRLSGVELQGQAREDYARISEELAQTSQQFSEHVLDAIDQWHYLVTDEKELEGVPADVLAAAARAAQENGQQGWRLTLKMPCYLPVMQYARNQDLRELLYRAYTTVASE